MNVCKVLVDQGSLLAGSIVVKLQYSSLQSLIQ